MKRTITTKETKAEELAVTPTAEAGRGGVSAESNEVVK